MNELIALMRERINYDPETGDMHYTSKAKGGRSAGEKVGSPEKHGYIKVNFQGKKYLAHRLIWMLVYGREAQGLVDHINGDRTDNRLANLRECTKQQNTVNSSRSRGVLNLRGVTELPSGKFQAQIKRGGRSIYLGCFNSKEEASEAYKLASIVEHGEFSPYHSTQLTGGVA